MTPDLALAHAAIRDLLSRYTYNGDRGRVAELAACFADDGVLIFPGNSGTGPAGVADALSGGGNPVPLHPDRPVPERPTLIRHHITNPLIDVAADGQSASARSYFMVVADNGPDHSGTYVDELVLTAAGWRFARREVRVDWQSPTSRFRWMVTR